MSSPIVLSRPAVPGFPDTARVRTAFERRPWLLPLLAAAALAAVYWAASPHTADLAAQTARGELFRRDGFVPYWAGWYSGIPTASYSMVTPPLLGWLGPIPLGALSVVATTAVAIPLLSRSRRPTMAGIAVAVAATLDVTSGRTTFAIGGVVMLAGLLAIQRQRPVLAGCLGLLSAFSSPVAGFLLLILATGVVLSDRPRRVVAGAAGGGVLLGLAALDILARGAGAGQQPFSVSSLLLALATTAVVVIAGGMRQVRVTAVVSMVALLGVFVVPSGVGSNVTRLVILGSAPAVVAMCRWPAKMTATAALLAALLPIFQVRNDLVASSHHDASPSFTAGLTSELATLPAARTHRVEVVDTETHWPSTELLSSVVLARGWERQVDVAHNPEFYGRASLTAATYRTFLNTNAVSYVAVARGVPLDYGSIREQQLVSTGLPYLRPIWQDTHWQLYAVKHPVPIVAAPAKVASLTQTGVVLDLPGPGSYALRLNYSPYLSVDNGRIDRSGDETVVQVARAGTVVVRSSWARI